MDQETLSEWNRKLISETLQILEESRDQAEEVISRLRGFLAVNPGRPKVPPSTEPMSSEHNGLAFPFSRPGP